MICLIQVIKSLHPASGSGDPEERLAAFRSIKGEDALGAGFQNLAVAVVPGQKALRGNSQLGEGPDPG